MLTCRRLPLTCNNCWPTTFYHRPATGYNWPGAPPAWDLRLQQRGRGWGRQDPHHPDRPQTPGMDRDKKSFSLLSVCFNQNWIFSPFARNLAISYICKGKYKMMRQSVESIYQCRCSFLTFECSSSDKKYCIRPFQGLFNTCATF